MSPAQTSVIFHHPMNVPEGIQPVYTNSHHFDTEKRGYRPIFTTPIVAGYLHYTQPTKQFKSSSVIQGFILCRFGSMINRFLLLLSLILGMTTVSRASHIVGGEMYYDCLGGNQYRITVKLYRDCLSTGAAFDNPLPITVFNDANVQIDYFTIAFPGSTTLDVVFSNPCVVPPTDICVEEAIYTAIRTLPASPGGYTISYQRCCRGPAVANLFDPANTGITLSVEIPPVADAVCNSSPRFTNYPPLLLCASTELNFDHSATDPDGDVLVYELCDPFSGGTSTAPAPDPAFAPPYTPVTWEAGLSALNPFPLGGTITINPVTGQLLATPEALGLYAVGVCCKEYRAGVLISITRRDFLFRVMDCEISMEASVVPQVDMTTWVSYCQGLTVDFENGSFGGTNYSWDFGVPGITTDVSTAFEPTYTFPSAGTYTITLIVNPGWPCTDTSTEIFIINDAISAEFVRPDPQCITGNSFDFFGEGEYPPVADGTTFEWDFGAGAAPATATSEDVLDVTFSTSGYHPVTFTVYYEMCETFITDSVFVYAEPTIDFTIVDELRCAPYDAHFIDLSTADTDIFYEWNFGDGSELSPDENPTHVYENPGVYDVQLTIWTTEGCVTTLTLLKDDLIEVFPSPVSAFTVNPPEADVFHPHFYFSDLSIDGDQHYYYFTDGASTEERFVWHTYVESGWHYPYQVVINQYGCPDTSWQSLYVIPYTTIYIPNAFTPDGNSFNNVWLPIVHDTKAYRLYVYNRWGEIMVNTDNEKQGWNGTTQSGDLAPQGVYTYKIWWVDADTGMPDEKIGHFSLLR